MSACMAPLGVSAQERAAAPPPQLEKLEEGEAPAVTIPKPDPGPESVEKRARGGKITEVQVTSRGSTYYLKPNDQTGSAMPGDIQANTLRGAQWRIMGFDLFGSKNPKNKAAQTAVPPPALEPSEQQNK